MSIKNKALEAKDSTTRVLHNGEKFVQAAALFMLVGFSYWSLQHVHVGQVCKYAVLTALVVTGLRAAYEMVKFLDREVK